MSKTRYYWLGHDEPCEQDRLFLDALDSNLWQPGSQEQWDTCWYTGMPEKDVFEQLDASKTINHIPGNNALTIKSSLYDTLTNARHRLEGAEAAKRFDFFPETFSMPEDYQRFLSTAREEPQQLWIKKPKNLSRGRGIDMVRHPRQFLSITNGLSSDISASLIYAKAENMSYAVMCSLLP